MRLPQRAPPLPCFHRRPFRVRRADMTGRKRDIDDLAGEIQELFADMWQVPRFSAGLRQGYRPQADCYQTDDPPALNVVVELPGVDPSSVEVVVAGRALTVGGT